MAINKKLIHFQNKTNFLNKLEAGEILDTSIVFIRDAKQIWTHGELYSCPYTEEEINQLFVGSNIKLTGYAEMDSPVTILATDTVNDAFGKIEDYLNGISELNAILVDTGDAALDPIINDYITSEELSTELQNYVTDSELAAKGYITASQVPNPDLSSYATKDYVNTEIANLVDSAPDTLNTLNELATAISEHKEVTDALDTAITNKLDKTEAASTYQPIGDYAKTSDIEEINAILSLSKYEFVDLGLPSGLKWASCNVGAEKPEDFGLYFAWGETEGYEGITDEKQFSWADYKFSIDGSSSNFSKYNSIDGLTTLEQIDDVAYVSDNTCRMPTKAELEELTANTTSTWETLNGVNGRRFTSKTNDNSIFVPAAGSYSSGSVYDVGSIGGMWGSSLSESNSRYAWRLDFHSNNVSVYDSGRCNGISVRPVQEVTTNSFYLRNYYTKGQIDEKVPTKVSELENDVPYALKSEVEVEIEVEAENGIYAVTADGKLIDYNTADSTCIGVALIQGEHQFMIEKTESYDAGNLTFRWGQGLYNKNVAGITEISTADGTNSYGNLGSELSTDYTTWTNGVLSDFNGKNNTNAIITAYTEYSVDMYENDMCKVLQTFNAGTYGSNQGFTDWYIPACGQLALIYLNKTAINEALTAIGGTTFFYDTYWSSSEYSSNVGWYIHFGMGSVEGNYKEGRGNVRFVRDLITIKPLKEKVEELETSISDLKQNYFKWSNLELLKNRGSLSLIQSVAASPDSIPYVLSINFEYPVESDITINYTYYEPFGGSIMESTLVCEKGQTSASATLQGTEDVSDFDFVFNSFSPTEDDVYEYEIIFG